MEFEFNSDGFLSERADDLERGIRASNENLFDLARRLNRECHELFFAACVRKSDGRAILCATLFLRTLEHYQATIILLGKGIVAAARTVLRAVVESTFRLRAIAIKDDAWRTFILEDDASRVKAMNKARFHEHPILEGLRAAATDQVIADLKKNNKSSGARILSAEEWSKLAGMHDWYVTHYELLSKAVHTQVRDLEGYLVVDQSDDVTEFLYAPSIEEIPSLVLMATDLMLIDAMTYDGVFEVGFESKAVALRDLIDSEYTALVAASENSA